MEGEAATHPHHALNPAARPAEEIHDLCRDLANLMNPAGGGLRVGELLRARRFQEEHGEPEEEEGSGKRAGGDQKTGEEAGGKLGHVSSLGRREMEEKGHVARTQLLVPASQSDAGRRVGWVSWG